MFFAWLSAAVLLQSSTTGLSGILGQVDLVALLVMVWASLRGPVAGLQAALVGGVLLDLVGTMPLGGSVVALAPGAYLFGQVRQWLVGPLAWLTILAALMGTACASFIVAALMVPLGGAAIWTQPEELLLRAVASPALVNGILAAASWPLVERWERRQPASV